MKTSLKVLNSLLAINRLFVIISLLGIFSIVGQIVYIPTAYCQTESNTDSNLKTSTASFFVRFYQRFISAFDGNRCPMYPSCSHYSIQSLKKHGFLMGWLMTCDRLLHEPDEMHLAPVIVINGKALSYDPVASNDQWWYQNFQDEKSSR